MQTNRTKEITVGESPTIKKRTAYAILFVGHLGLETFSGMPSTTRVSLGDPSTSLFAVGAAGANEQNEGDNLGPLDYESVALTGFSDCH